MKHARFDNALFAAALLLAATAYAQPLQLPAAAVRNVPAQHHGTTVDDPYRWMEDVKAPETQAWMRAQGDATRALLDRIDGRERIAARMDELAQHTGDVIYDVKRFGTGAGDRLYYLKRERGGSQFKLYLRHGLAGAEKLLVDPEAIARKTGVPHAVNFYSPSWDGRWVAYGMSGGGSEDASLYLLEVATGRLAGEPVPRVYENGVNWLPDSRSLFATQFRAMAAGEAETERYKDSRVLWLKPGGREADAKVVFGPTVVPGLKLDRLDVATLIVQPGSRWLLARTTDTTSPEGKLFVAPLAQLTAPGPAKAGPPLRGSGKVAEPHLPDQRGGDPASIRWRALVGEADKVVQVALRGDTLVYRTHNGAPRHELRALDLRRPELARARLVARAPDDGVIEGFQLTPRGVVAEVRQGTRIVLRRHAPGDTVGRPLPVPGAGAAALAQVPAHDREALLFRFDSWTALPQWYEADASRLKPVRLSAAATLPGSPDVQVTETDVPSHDGARVPLTVLHRKGLARDGSAPVLLDGYGAYGFSTSAYFSRRNIVWLEMGGVLAFVNPRGSGVKGDEWHRAGFKTTKANTWKDGIAAARWLIAQGYGSPKTMAVTGGSAGGIFAGRAATEAPELFAAAVLEVGMLDAVRSEESANGATNISEFGTVKNKAEFEALLGMSTYHQIRPGVRYPGTLLIHGMNDPRVDVWNSAKAAARLQAAGAGLTDARPALLRLDAQAGHGIGSTRAQRDAEVADAYAFMLWQMGKRSLKD